MTCYPGNLDSKTQTLVSIMDGSLLTQLIVSPTRVTMNSRTLIDHMYTTCGDNHVLSGVVKTHVSDHFLTFTIVNCNDVNEPPKTLLDLGPSRILRKMHLLMILFNYHLLTFKEKAMSMKLGVNGMIC